MNMWALCRSALRSLVFGVCVLLGAGWSQAQPANDNYANREVISSLPFADTETAIGLATVEATDPQILCRQGAIGTGGNTVWYSYTSGPADEYLDFTTVNSDDYTIVAFYTGGPGAFTLVSGGCDDDGVSNRAHVAGLRLRANTTYSIVVARPTQSSATATLRVFVDVAPVYHVTKTADTADGVCDADCSLREAISASNAIPGAVVVPAGTYALTLPGREDNNAGGDIDLRARIGIYGAGTTNTVVDAGSLDRAIDVVPGNTAHVSAHLNGLMLTHGNTLGYGGGLWMRNDLDFLALEDVAITNSVSSNNGGGLALSAGALLRRVTVSGNQSGGNGGGIVVADGGRVEIRDSTISNNVSLAPINGGGGGIYSRAQVRIYQATISGNRANFTGGGVLVEGAASLVMRNATVAENIADADNNDTSSGGGIYLSNNDGADIANSVIANNHAYGGLPSDLNDCSRLPNLPLVSAYNHVRRFDNCIFEGPGDTKLDDPLLAPLADNGGPTKTHAILPGSVLIDAGDPAGCRDDNGIAFVYDQRGPGFPRTVGIKCDKGAYEFNPAAPPPPTPPNAPSNLIAFAINNTSASLQWSDNSNNEDSFQIERAPLASGPWANVGSVLANMTMFTDNTLGPLMDYYYRVFARNAVGDSVPTMPVPVHTMPVELQSFTIE